MRPNQPAIKKAVAVHYDPDQHEAPQVTAKGEGFVAERIIDEAMKHQIPIYEDPSLVELLGKIELNEQIPEELYGVMAEVLTMIYQLDHQLKKEREKNP